MTARVIDFDKFRAEQRAAAGGSQPEPPEIIISGAKYLLPVDLPASIALDVARIQKERSAGGMVSPAMLVSIGEQLFGADVFKGILDKELMGVREMGDLLIQCFRVYQTDEKEAVPNRKARRQPKRSTSSKTGRS